DALVVDIGSGFRYIRRMIGFGYEAPSQEYDQQHDAYFDNDDDIVEEGGLFDAPHQQQADHGNDEQCRQVDNAPYTFFGDLEGRMAPFIGDRREMQHLYQQVIEILAPRYTYSGGTH